MIDDKPVKFIVDGVSVGKVIPKMTFSDLTYYLKSHNAEDIKGIEINSSSKYAVKYIPGDFAAIIGPSEVTLIDITTRSGHGVWITNTPGTYLYKPLALGWPKEFYKPRYAVVDTAKRLPILRSTVDWEPNVSTDKDGNATVSFFAADKPGNYTVIFEGTDGNGNVGSKRTKIKIEKGPVTQKSK